MTLELTGIEVVDALFPKYQRIGYVDLGRHCDKLLSNFTQNLPGDNYLPARWRFGSLSNFCAKYSHLGLCLWAASYNSHLLVINGHRIVRIWTDAKNHCWVDGLAHVFLPSMLLENIPKKNIRKSVPFTVRTKIIAPQDMVDLALNIRHIHGV